MLAFKYHQRYANCRFILHNNSFTISQLQIKQIIIYSSSFQNSVIVKLILNEIRFELVFLSFSEFGNKLEGGSIDDGFSEIPYLFRYC